MRWAEPCYERRRPSHYDFGHTMNSLAIFTIKNSALNTGVSVALLILGVLYLALIFWTFADARRRIDDPLLVACATLCSFFPFIGTIVYVIVRPPEFLEDVRERELEKIGRASCRERV